MERAEGAKIFADLFHKWQFQNVKLDNFHPNNPDISSPLQSLIVSTWEKIAGPCKICLDCFYFLLTTIMFDLCWLYWLLADGTNPE